MVVTLWDVLIALIVSFGLTIVVGAMFLRLLGFSTCKGALITTTFLCLGFWNPIGWIVLGLCIWLQLKENRDRLLAAAAQPQVPPPGPTRVEVGPVASAGGARRPMLRRGDRC